MDAYTKAIKTAGGITRLAEAIGISPQHLCNWRSRGIPAERVLPIVRATGGAVTPYELRPDIYPDPAWLPPDPPPEPDDPGAA